MAGVSVVRGMAVVMAMASVLAAEQGPYSGKPFAGQTRTIPGRVEAELYDTGGEAVAFHDSDAANSGSGMLNKGDSDVDKFRKDEAVDLSYTKAGIDKTIDGQDEKPGELYLGWTAPGEWAKYTVQVERSGAYVVAAHISSRFDDAVISLAFDGVDKTGPIAVPTTSHWHKWRIVDHLCEVTLDKGLHTMILSILKQGNMNIDYLEFIPKDKAKSSTPAVAQADAKAFSQAARVGRCVNVLGYDPIWDNREKARFQEKYFRLIHEAGFQSIRVNLHALNRMDSENRLSDSWWQVTDWIVKNALANQLAVILDLHNFTDVAGDPNAFRPKIMAFWKQVSEHYKDAPDAVMFELLNEPNGKLNAPLWNEFLADMLKIIRQTNPDRTIVVGPASWNGITALPTLKLPEADRNLIVTVHYYQPMNFTHQGAPWSKSTANLSGVTWGTNEEMRRADEDLWKANRWARENRRPLFLGEFGAYDKAEMQYRTLYIGYIARTAETLGWAWGYWQFDSDFIVYDIPKDQWVQPILTALIPQVP
jgi:endoglucanase